MASGLSVLLFRPDSSEQCYAAERVRTQVPSLRRRKTSFLLRRGGTASGCAAPAKKRGHMSALRPRQCSKSLPLPCCLSV